MKTWDKAVLIPIDQLRFTDWNCNELGDIEFAALLEDIEQGSFDEPAQVVPVEGGYLVIGGEHRTKALQALEAEEVPCVIRHDLALKSRKDLMLWSVRRNNVRGRVDAQKYAKLEQELIEQHQMTAEAARRTMLISGDLLKALKKKEKNGTDSDPADECDEAQDTRNRETLLQALRTAVQDVLLQSGDTVEHGYLFFSLANKSHLVVDESPLLAQLVRRMVEVCKGEEQSVDVFLCAALRGELANRE